MKSTKRQNGDPAPGGARKESPGGRALRALAHAGYWVPLLLYGALIWYMSSRTIVPGSGLFTFPLGDKVGHALMFGLLAAFLWRALRGSLGLSPTGALALSTVVLVALYGIADEIHQSYVPGRSADPFDFAADAAGAALVTVALYAAARRRDRAKSGSGKEPCPRENSG